MLGVVTTWFSGRMMLRDRRNFSLRDAGRGLWRMWGRNGAFSSLIPTWVAYFKPGYHPWDKDNRDLIARFKADIQTHIAPEYRNGNRRTLQ